MLTIADSLNMTEIKDFQNEWGCCENLEFGQFLQFLKSKTGNTSFLIAGRSRRDVKVTHSSTAKKYFLHRQILLEPNKFKVKNYEKTFLFLIEVSRDS